MKFQVSLISLLVGIVFGTSSLTTTLARDNGAPEVETHHYASDISKLRNIVVHSLYSHKDVFLRELLSNAQDALEKLKLTSLKDESLRGSAVMAEWAGNITIEARRNLDGSKGGELVIRDTGIGMNKDELAKNLGTIAKSGTSDFLQKAMDSSASQDSGNLIGQFGLGFYSSFLVSPSVRVSSLPPPTVDNPTPEQYTFISSSTGDDFSIFKDPRGNSLIEAGPCGTEIVLEIEEEEAWVLDEAKLRELVEKHSQFASTFPIYLLSPAEATTKAEAETTEDEDEEVVVTSTGATTVRLNEKGPLWMREPKELSDEDYKEFYKVMAKDQAEPLSWSHWRGDSGSGVSFRALMYIPSKLPEDFWQNALAGSRAVRLMVKRVFITDDLGEAYLPRWLSFLRIVVDADDLPLNVSRESLQNNRFVKQLQRILVRKAIDMFTKLAKDDAEEFKEFSKTYGMAVRFGVMDTKDKDRQKLAELLRFSSSDRDSVSLAEYVASRKDGQKHIFYLAGTGESIEELAKSPVAELAIARGYEVLLLNQPADEPVMEALKSYGGMKFQDVSRKGFKFGDENDDATEKAELERQKKAFKPLLVWLKEFLKGPFTDVVLSNRLVISPCAVVADSYGYSASMLRYLEAQARPEDDAIRNFARSQGKILEINPKNPLIAGMLEKIVELNEEDDGGVGSAEEQDLKDLLGVLVDATLVRSGYPVTDSQEYFERIEALLRRAIGVSLHAKGTAAVKPAPPIATGPVEEDEPGMFHFDSLNDADRSIIKGGSGGQPSEDGSDSDFVDWQKMKAYLAAKEASGEGVPGQGDEPMEKDEVDRMMEEVKRFGAHAEHDEL